MRYQIKMMSGDKYWITEQEFYNLSRVKEKGLIYITSVEGLVNFSSVESIIREDKIQLENKNEVVLQDGTKAVKKFNEWFVEGTDIKIDVKRYPELVKDIDIKQLKDRDINCG